jgi:AbrB family looped-hinge helix DNA binding protein
MTASDVSSAKIDSKGRILLPPSLRSELDLEPGDSVSLKRTRVGLVVTPARKRDYLSKFRELIETPPKRTGKPRNPSPSQMKKIWKERLS